MSLNLDWHCLHTNAFLLYELLSVLPNQIFVYNYNNTPYIQTAFLLYEFLSVLSNHIFVYI
jgi:hypothetical protein